MITVSKEDYLKAILEAEGEGETVISATLAHWLKVSPPAVTMALRRLKKDGYVRVQPDGQVRLTAAGRKIARRLTLRHHLIERMLSEMFDMEWYKVHDEAERLEHAVSERLIDRIDEMLGRPEVDPHGDPIPTPEGTVPVQRHLDLLTAPLGTSFTVTRVLDQDAAFLRFLEAHGLTPGSALVIEARDAAAQTVRVRGARRAPMTIGWRAASRVLVQP